MAPAHSASRWVNQLVFQLSPSISRNNLGDIIKVPFYLSKGEGALLMSLIMEKRSALNEIWIRVFSVATL